MRLARVPVGHVRRWQRPHDVPGQRGPAQHRLQRQRRPHLRGRAARRPRRTDLPQADRGLQALGEAAGGEQQEDHRMRRFDEI